MARAMILAAALVALPLGASGCFLFHDDYPDRSCESDLDCFRSQGEVCNTDTNTCEVPEVDAGSSLQSTGEGEGDDHL